MEDIEYLEEYEDMVLPSIQTDAPQREEEDSSSIDQDIFERIFDNNSDDDDEYDDDDYDDYDLTLANQNTNKSNDDSDDSASVDSLDLLVKDLAIPQQQQPRAIPNAASSAHIKTNSSPKTTTVNKKLETTVSANTSKAANKGSDEVNANNKNVQKTIQNIMSTIKSVATVHPTFKNQTPAKSSVTTRVTARPQQRRSNFVTSNIATQSSSTPKITVPKSNAAQNNSTTTNTTNSNLKKSSLQKTNYGDTDSDTYSSHTGTLSYLTDDTFDCLSGFDDDDDDLFNSESELSDIFNLYKENRNSSANASKEKNSKTAKLTETKKQQSNLSTVSNRMQPSSTQAAVGKKTEVKILTTKHNITKKGTTKRDATTAETDKNKNKDQAVKNKKNEEQSIDANKKKSYPDYNEFEELEREINIILDEETKPSTKITNNIKSSVTPKTEKNENAVTENKDKNMVVADSTTFDENTASQSTKEIAIESEVQNESADSVKDPLKVVDSAASKENTTKTATIQDTIKDNNNSKEVTTPTKSNENTTTIKLSPMASEENVLKLSKTPEKIPTISNNKSLFKNREIGLQAATVKQVTALPNKLSKVNFEENDQSLTKTKPEKIVNKYSFKNREIGLQAATNKQKTRVQIKSKEYPPIKLPTTNSDKSIEQLSKDQPKKIDSIGKYTTNAFKNREIGLEAATRQEQSSVNTTKTAQKSHEKLTTKADKSVESLEKSTNQNKNVNKTSESKNCLADLKLKSNELKEKIVERKLMLENERLNFINAKALYNSKLDNSESSNMQNDEIDNANKNKSTTISKDDLENKSKMLDNSPNTIADEQKNTSTSTESNNMTKSMKAIQNENMATPERKFPNILRRSKTDTKTKGSTSLAEFFKSVLNKQTTSAASSAKKTNKLLVNEKVPESVEMKRNARKRAAESSAIGKLDVSTPKIKAARKEKLTASVMENKDDKSKEQTICSKEDIVAKKQLKRGMESIEINTPNKKQRMNKDAETNDSKKTCSTPEQQEDKLIDDETLLATPTNAEIKPASVRKSTSPSKMLREKRVSFSPANLEETKNQLNEVKQRLRRVCTPPMKSTPTDDSKRRVRNQSPLIRTATRNLQSGSATPEPKISKQTRKTNITPLTLKEVPLEDLSKGNKNAKYDNWLNVKVRVDCDFVSKYLKEQNERMANAKEMTTAMEVRNNSSMNMNSMSTANMLLNKNNLNSEKKPMTGRAQVFTIPPQHRRCPIIPSPVQNLPVTKTVDTLKATSNLEITAVASENSIFKTSPTKMTNSNIETKASDKSAVKTSMEKGTLNKDKNEKMEILDMGASSLYSFLQPKAKTRVQDGLLLDKCCPNIDQNMPGVSRSLKHTVVTRNVVELPSYIVMETKVITRQDLGSGRTKIPNSIRQRVERMSSSSANKTVKNKDNVIMMQTMSALDSLLQRSLPTYLNLSASERQTYIQQFITMPNVKVNDVKLMHSLLDKFLATIKSFDDTTPEKLARSDDLANKRRTLPVGNSKAVQPSCTTAKSTKLDTNGTNSSSAQVAPGENLSKSSVLVAEPVEEVITVKATRNLTKIQTIVKRRRTTNKAAELLNDENTDTTTTKHYIDNEFVNDNTLETIDTDVEECILPDFQGIDKIPVVVKAETIEDEELLGSQ